MAEWIRNGHECSECGFRLLYPAEYYEWIERGDHGYLFKNYAVIPSECPKCHNEMTAVVYEGGTDNCMKICSGSLDVAPMQNTVVQDASLKIL